MKYGSERHREHSSAALRAIRRWHLALLAAVMLGTAGCGGSSSHLPEPRPPDDEEPPPATAASTPAPAAASSAAALSPAPSAVTTPPMQATVAPPPRGIPAVVPIPKAEGETDKDSAPAAGVPPVEQRMRTIDQLKQIGRLFDGHRGQSSNYHTYPGPYTLPNLSWRVAMLSSREEYEGLAASLRRDELWDSPNNRRSLGKIPDLFRFQSPQQQDGRTNLVLMTGPGTIYDGQKRANDANCPDGLDETILAIAVSDQFAVPWTSPQDYAFSPETAHEALFGLYRDCCYALFGGASGVRRIPATISDEHLLALITPDGGEPVSAIDVTRPPTPEPDEELIQYLHEKPIVRFVKLEKPAPTAKDPSDPNGELAVKVARTVSSSVSAEPLIRPSMSPDAKLAPDSPADDGRLPVPDEISQQLARRVLREAHREDYTKAKTDDEKKELADKLLARARSPDIDPAGRYVALELSRKIAAEIGDIPKALEALELTTQGFQTEGRAEKAEILVSSIGLPLSESDNELVLSEGRKWMEQALERDEFDLADQFLNAALSAARRTRDTKLITALTARKKEIADARAARAEVADYIDLLLQHPTHPEANEIVGTYYCLVKQRWEDGLPLLARAADPRLVELAEAELKLPATPVEQVALADRWWNLAEGDTRHKLAIRARSAYWYRQALSGLPPGLERIKVESRLAKAESKDRTERRVETP